MVNPRAKLEEIQNTLAEFNDQHTQSGELIGSNDDLLTEILLRLPAASILRFKSVSKHWLSLLSHRRFTLLYDKLLISPGLFVCDSYIPLDAEDGSPPPIRSLDFCPGIRGMRIVQSCNGLLLCRGKKCIGKYFVFNPTTKQFTVIPPIIGGPRAHLLIRFMGLAFHPTDCVHYKLVCILHSEPDEGVFQVLQDQLFLPDEGVFQVLLDQLFLLHIQIYSSDTGKWKISNESKAKSYYTDFNLGVYCNGAIYWAPTCLNPFYFKLDVELLQTLPSPLPIKVASSGGYTHEKIPHYLGESRGHLHMVVTTDYKSHLHLNVYEMLSDHSGWFSKYQVDFHELLTTYPLRMFDNFEVCDVVRGEKERDTIMVVRSSQKIIRYNVVDKSFKLISDLNNSLHGRTILGNVHPYIRTLGSF